MRIFELSKARFADLYFDVQNYLKQTLNSTDNEYSPNSIFGQLIGVVEGISQNMLAYIEDALTEQNKYTAQRKRSIMNLAELSGYTPSLGKAATCNVTLSYIPNNEKNTDVVLAHKTKIRCLNNGLTYNVILPQESIVLNIEKTNASKELFLVEGTYETQVFTATGGEYYSQNVSIQGDIDTDFLEVRVNGEKYEQVESLYDMNALGFQYTVKTGYKNGITIIFGNNEQGLQIYDGDQIEVTYLIHHGENGNINFDTNTSFAFEDTLQNVAGETVEANEIFNITLTNQAGITNGTFSENTAKIKQMIGYNSRSNVLSDAKNYKLMLSRYSFVGYNKTWSEMGSLVVNSLVLNNYKRLVKKGDDYFKLTEQDFFLTNDQKQSIKNSIGNSGHQLAGVIYNIYDAKIQKYAMYCYVTLKDTSYDTTYIENKIRQKVGQFFCELNNDMFVPKSDLIHLLKSTIDGIDSVDIYFLSEENETAILNRYYNKKTRNYSLVNGTFLTETNKVWLEYGEDPGLGLDEHGNILLEDEDTFPVLMGGWDYKVSKDTTDTTHVNDPLTIVFK